MEPTAGRPFIPRQKIPCGYRINDEITSWKASKGSFKIRNWSYGETEITPYRQFQILSQSFSRGEEDSTGYGFYTVDGELKNTGDKKAFGVQAIASFYDVAGNIIAWNHTVWLERYEEMDLEPSQVASFRIVLFQHKSILDKIANYDLWFVCSDWA
jgi:hypothetical protein